jgi:hypothetical protein
MMPDDNHDLSAERGRLTPLEIRARELYDFCCHDRDDFLSLRHKAGHSREAAGLYRQWLALAARHMRKSP